MRPIIFDESYRNRQIVPSTQWPALDFGNWYSVGDAAIQVAEGPLHVLDPDREHAYRQFWHYRTTSNLSELSNHTPTFGLTSFCCS